MQYERQKNCDCSNGFVVEDKHFIKWVKSMECLFKLSPDRG